MNKNLERLIYVIALVTAVLSLFFIYNTVLSILLFVLSSVYLLLGWLLLNPVRTKKFDLLYFFTGYVFSTVMMGLLFRNRDYPMKEIILYVSAGMLVIILLLVFFIDRARNRPVTENCIKIFPMLVLTLLAAVTL